MTALDVDTITTACTYIFHNTCLLYIHVYSKLVASKTCIVHTSNFLTLVIHKINLEYLIDVIFLGILEPLLLYDP